jgi:multiple sugar transport system permease protein
MDLDEAARIDGAGPLQVFFLVLLPLVKPVIAAVTVLTFLHTWNDFLRPVIYLSSTDHYTIPLGLRFFASHAGVGSTGPMTGLLMAAALLATLPVVAIFVAAQRHFIQGIALTGVNR